ncbi:MAG: hypothetical protein EX258_10320 [Sphingomonadaceae bacterium]|nr:hypothetical protein [Paracoccaceae bacterium]RZV45597.1 MAG: hypothetical protein EX258_10320 [Sphingomonadaceae bacterium]
MAVRPRFTLTVATSRDAFIARATDDSPASWVSAEEQALFFADVEAADWAIMGRHTHLAADRPDRRRIIFSASAAPGWHRPKQLWLNPEGMAPADLAEKVSQVRTLGKGLILGGTRVHDWFLAARAIDRVHLTIEPISFGSGLPIFSDQESRDPKAVFSAHGFAKIEERPLNDSGTLYSVWQPAAPAGLRSGGD